MCNVCPVPISIHKFKKKVNYIKSPIKNLLKFVSGFLISFHSSLRLETVFSALKLTQICCTNMKVSFLENWQFNQKLAPVLLNTYQA